MALATVSVNDWTAGGMVVLDAVNVSEYGEPVTVPDAGVPDRRPALNVTPLGSVPPEWAMPGVGVPVAVTVKLPDERTVKVVAFALVICGATGVLTGVTITESDGPLVPAALVAVTVHVYGVSLRSPVTVTGETVLLAAPLGVHVALYPVTGLPPLFAGGENAMAAWRLPGVAVPMTGALGAVAVMATSCVTCKAAL